MRGAQHVNCFHRLPEVKGGSYAALVDTGLTYPSNKFLIMRLSKEVVKWPIRQKSI
ncbi:hypothetical protein Psch_01738 [Pelotomaculum schinkii]|uniref:Uncharacterized protein n=1 Tax=Pelotomaculum schinkii TaxID=78350 RepID=A0A4Y7RHB4_9FIRM|nr:hypothetical protein Psch_01738 [Pelotomaculum schinkii]TEB14230.1 hypothetical protein Psfp_03051 [Pelotomaculum sp. FP]